MDTILICLAFLLTAANCATTNLRNPVVPSIHPTAPPPETTTLKSKRGVTSHAWSSKEIHRPQPGSPSVSGSHPVQETSLQSNGRTKPPSTYRSVKPRQNVPYGAPNHSANQSYRNVGPHSATSGYSSGFRPSFNQAAISENPAQYSQASVAGGSESRQNGKSKMPIYEYFFGNNGAYNTDGRKSLKLVAPQNFRELAQSPLNEKKVHVGTTVLNGLNGQYVPFYSTKYAPSYQPVTNFAPSGQSAEGVTQYVAPDAMTVEVNGKKLSLPLLGVQGGQNFPGYLQAFESQPLLFNANLEYQGQPSFDYNFAAKANVPQPSGSDGQPVSPIIGYQAQVVPIQTASSSPEFPQYRGASVNVFPGVNGPKAGAIYEPIQTQPQLHFATAGQVAPVNAHRTVYRGKPSAEIRDDVEVIKKKKPTTPPPRDNDDADDDELDEGYKAIEKEYGRYSDEEDDSQGNKYRDQPRSEGEFTPSTSYPFKAYDDQFGRYSKQGNKDESDDETTSNYRSYSSREDEEDDDSYPKFHADYSSKKVRYEKYGQSENQGQERRGENSEEDPDYEIQSKRLFSGKDLEQEFEDSYRKEIPLAKYAHVKEVPEIDESQYTSSGVKSSRKSQRGTSGYRSRQEKPEEPKTQGSRSIYRLKSRNNYRDSEGHGSDKSVKKIPRIVHEESFSFNTQHNTEYSKHPKKVIPGDRQISGNKKDSHRQSTKANYKGKSVIDPSSYGNAESFSFSGGSGRKSGESPLEGTSRLPGSITKDSSDLTEQNVFSQRQLGNDARSRSLTTQEVLHGLIGI